MKPELVWCAPTRMPYTDDLLVRLAADQDLELKVVYAKDSLAAYPMRDLGTSTYAATTASTTLAVFRLLSRTFRRSPVWVVAGWGTPQFAAVMTLLSLLGRRYWIFTDAPIVEGRTGSGFKRQIRRALLAWWFRHATGILGTGDMAVQALEAMGAPASKINSFPYPLDEGRFPVGTDRSSNDPGPVDVLMTGRLSIRDKRHDVALRAFALIQQEVHPCTLHIVGSGPDEAEVRALVHDLGLSEQVRFTSWMTQQDLRDAYQAADLYLHAADFEPYGVTVVEALYSGLYTIASNGVGAAIELLASGAAGTTFRAGDPHALATNLSKAITMVAQHGTAKGAVRKAALRWPIERHHRMARQMLVGLQP